MKVKINNEEYEMIVAPREYTAVFIAKDEKIDVDKDHAFRVYNCPYSKDDEKLAIDDTKKLAENDEKKLQEYLQMNKNLHKFLKENK